MGRKAKKEVLEDLQEQYREQDSEDNGRRYFEAEKKVALDKAYQKRVKKDFDKGECLTEICCDCCCDEGCEFVMNLICNH